MKAIFDVGHPAHVHLFKNSIANLIKEDWEILVVARSRETTVELADHYGFNYLVFNHYEGIIKKILGMINIDYKFLKLARSYKPDLFVSVGSPFAANVSLIMRRPHIAFVDTPAKKNSLYYLAIYTMLKPRNNLIVTPDIFPMNFSSKKQIFYKGYHEIAYLHPNYFTPDISILEKSGINPKSEYIIVRFAAWDAIHDMGHMGFKNTQERIDFIKNLASRIKVFVTSEVRIPELNEYEIPISIENMHHLLYFAKLYIGEGATMASEAGVLGIPWIFLYTKKLPYLDDQEKNYGLGFTVNNANKAYKIAYSLLNNEKLKQEWFKKRKKLLNEKIDVTSFMTKLIKDIKKNNYKEKTLNNYGK